MRLRGLVMALALVGCASAPPERLYRLSSGAVAGAGSSARSLVVTATLPDEIDRPQLVVRTGANRVALLEQQRWAEPLREGIPRVVAEDLGKLLGTHQVSNRDAVIRQPDCRVTLDVRRFDAQPGRAVDVEALWLVTCAGAERQLGHASAHEVVADGSYDALIAAQGRALGQVSRSIAPALVRE
jgi:uncharacterized lipoprotein YmbA